MWLSSARRREEANIRSRQREEKEKEQETREERGTEATVETKDGKERDGESRQFFMVERGKECRHLRLGPVRSFGEIREERMQARHRRHHGCNSRLGFIAWEIGATAHRGGKHMGSLEE